MSKAVRFFLKQGYGEDWEYVFSSNNDTYAFFHSTGKTKVKRIRFSNRASIDNTLKKFFTIKNYHIV